MVVTVNITSNIEQVMKQTNDIFWNQVPFVTSRAINNSAFDVRKYIVFTTYPKAFDVKNKVFPGRAFKVIERATKHDLEAIIGDTLPDHAHMLTHSTGGQRAARRRIAIPQIPSEQRTTTGRVRKAHQPRQITERKGVYVVNKGDRTFIFRRINGADKSQLLYAIVPEATLKRSFRFYEDSDMVTRRVFERHWMMEFRRAIR